MVGRVDFAQYLFYVGFLLLLLVRAQFWVDLVPTVVLVQDSENLYPDLLEHLLDHGGLAHFQPVFRDVFDLYLVHESLCVVHCFLDVLNIIPLEGNLLRSDFDFDVVGLTHFLELFLVKLLVYDALFQADFDFLVP